MPTYRFLAISLDASGHIMSTLGFAEALKAAGHEVTFGHREKYRGLIEKRGFSFIPFDKVAVIEDDPMILLLSAFADQFRKEPFECFREMAKLLSSHANSSPDNSSPNTFSPASTSEPFSLFRSLNKVITERAHEFDAIIADFPGPVPRLYKDLLPWFPLISTSPLGLYPSGPPSSSGYSVKSDQSKWQEYKFLFNSVQQMLLNMSDEVKEIAKLSGFDLFDFDVEKYNNNVQSIGFYHYPADLDFTECGPRQPNWHRVDCWIRKPEANSEFIIPEKLQNKPGKLIYFSLGTLGSADIPVMKKLIAILAKSPHRFIVSKGPRGDSFQLADNMWGDNHVNQIKVIEKVDLVITHGGNNTFMETLYYGKPMIVIPYFYDQYDNAQRVVDKKIGFRVNPYEIDEDYLLDCIEKSVNDEELLKRIKNISQNMRNSNSLAEAIKMLEQQIELFKSGK